MRLTTKIALSAAGAIAAQWATRAYYKRDLLGSEVIKTHTRDGWQIAMTHYAARAPSRGRPIVLLHGFACNRFTWDLDDSVSFAKHLQSRGFDVYSLELRGHGLSESPPLRQGAYTWRFWDFVDEDLPAAFACIAKRHTKKPLFVGHSMGGNLLYAYLATGGREIAAGIAVASSVDYSAWDSGFHDWKKAEGFLERLPWFPFEPILRGVAPLAGRGLPNPIERFNFNPNNLDDKLARRLFAIGMETVSAEVARDLATAFDPGGLTDRDGALVKPRLADLDIPLLAIAGTVDEQCPTGAARNSLLATGQDESYLKIFGRLTGCETEYGHFDLLIGPRSPVEVWPTMTGFLEEQDDA